MPDDDLSHLHPLLAAHLSELAVQLPGDLVEEMADGLLATYDRLTVTCPTPDTAAAAAVAEFGDAGTIAREFRRVAPGRHLARLLLATGPPVGACWAATLISEHAWRWPVAAPLKVLFAALLAVLVASLVAVSLARYSYRRLNHFAAGAGLGLLAMDATLLTTLIALSPSLEGPPLLAVMASGARITLTGTRLPALLTRRPR